MKLGLASFILLNLCLTTILAQPIDSSKLKTNNYPDTVGLVDDIVISGTMNPVQTSKSPVFVESFQSAYFRKNIAATLFESLGMINGVRPQLNCNVCNTGDIHINGMEGPYTMVMIDGMPIMSSLGTVYGLVGIPQSLIEKVEIIKGPASSLYGSEAMAGLINIITKNPGSAPLFSAESNINSWGESNTDLSFKFKKGNFYSLSGANYFLYNGIIDQNNDGFTDIATQNRISLFEKIKYANKKTGSIDAGFRYVKEDRWGGQTNWTKQWRGSDSIYGESIYTERMEAIGKWQLPIKPDINIQFAWNSHRQNAAYGNTILIASQKIAFLQFIYHKKIGNHLVLFGAGARQQQYEDNSTARLAIADEKLINRTLLPGVFIQEETKLLKKQSLLLGYRLDHHPNHGLIHTPRIALKFLMPNADILRIQTGAGFRVVNLFTEEHAALTGARYINVTEALEPEKSRSVNLNYTLTRSKTHLYYKLDFAVFYNYFTNKIIADYTSNQNEIHFSNLNGYGICRGFSLQSDFVFSFPFKVNAGVTFNDIYSIQNGKTKIIQLLTPRWSGTFGGSYTFRRRALTADITGQVYSPMKLPTLMHDFRPQNSPWFSLLNAQITKKTRRQIEYYIGIKNILNFIPKNPIMRPQDPFDKEASDPVKNPNGYTFDTTYNYASLQGRRIAIGIKLSINN